MIALWTITSASYWSVTLPIATADTDRQTRPATSLLEENQQLLSAAVGRLKRLLAGEDVDLLDEIPPVLSELASRFDLSPFEQAVVLLCSAVELDSEISELLREITGQALPTFGFALSALPEAHWSALAPSAPLRYWRLVELQPGSLSGSGALSGAPLRIEERILHALTGINYLDEQLHGFVSPLNTQPADIPSQAAIAHDILRLWQRDMEVVQLTGTAVYDQLSVAAHVAQAAGMGIYRLDALMLPTTPNERDILTRLWVREAVLSESILLLDCHHLDQDAVRREAVRQFVESVHTPLIIASRERLRDIERPCFTIDVDLPNAAEQKQLWQQVLGGQTAELNGQVDTLVGQFALNRMQIESAARQAGEAPADGLADRLWEASRSQARAQLDDLAQRIVSNVTRHDLVLPQREMSTLREIATHLQQRLRVYETWGFAARSSRGLGINALFAGPSGTGKTLAAEVLANELRLDLYKIDLSQVVSKYIGETEKNLARVFDAAESGGAILFFDEADALFGKRSEVKDSHDRYANIEVSYLLQRMEAYRGLAILTTNMKQALDNAFLRRLRFIVTFRVPDAAQRALIWQRIFPPQTPLQDLDWERLAQLNVAGGNIRNIALNGAFLAASEGSPVTMAHLKRAAQAEYSKLERTLSSAEQRGWS
jgi:hypothetical protein